MSQDNFWRARWFLYRFRRYEVIFYAIARPKLFNPKLLDSLLNGGAILSRHLVQLLHLQHSPGGAKWGHRLGFASYMAVLEKARLQWGEDVSFLEHDIDEFSFGREVAYMRGPQVLSPKLLTIMQKFRYMPLPLWFVSLGQTGSDNRMKQDKPPESYLADQPKLAPLMVANGECCSDCTGFDVLTHQHRRLRDDLRIISLVVP